MRRFSSGLLFTLCTAALAAHPAGATEISAAMAEQMTAACIGYAKEHKGAVNIWVYDRTGEVVHFERMDGAPGIGSPPGFPPTGTPFGSALDSNAFNPSDPGDVPVRVANRNIGRVRVQGMGPAGDRACALAAAAVAK